MACQDGQFDVVELMIQNELCVKSSPFLIVLLYSFLYQEIKSSLYDIVNGTSMHKKWILEKCTWNDVERVT